jgi:hypothetical protein
MPEVIAPLVDTLARTTLDMAGAHVATFLDDEDQFVAVFACDTPFVA